MKLMMSQIFAQSCVLTFLAEWGDRSQISTIILAARDVSSATGFQLVAPEFPRILKSSEDS